ncbi:chemerin-like receptor 1 [Ranitomeya variabilis]|uniref:chemerin-like receptor 1 n=1 Tax=Ranitomeya variabilis TaxID=490064 RepID=UPI0040575E32
MDQEILEKMCHLIWEIHRSPELRALSPSTTHPTAFQYFNFTLSIFTCVMGFVANIIVIIVTGFLLKKNKYKIWFLNLAVADFTFILILPFNAVSEIRGKWLYGSSECKFFNFLGFVNTYASIYILTVLNIDRALSVAKPIWHRSFHSQKFCCFMCTFIWLSSAICSIPAIIYSDVYEENQCTLSYYDTSLVAYELSYRSENDSLDDSLEMCENISDVETSERRKLVADWREMTFTTERLVLPLAVVGYCIPLCLIVSSNIIIAFHVKNSTMAASSRLYRLVIFAVMSFFFARTPYVLTYIIFLVSVSSLKMILMYKLSAILPLLFTIAAMNTFLNPVVYVLLIKQARSELLNFLRRSRLRVIKRFSRTPHTQHSSAPAAPVPSDMTRSGDILSIQSTIG